MEEYMAILNELNRASTGKAKEVGSKVKDTTQKLYANTKDMARDKYTNVQQTMLANATQLLALLSAGLALVEGWLKYRQQLASERIKQASKHQAMLQETVQDTVQDTVMPAWKTTQTTLKSGLNVAQDTLEKNARKVQKNLQALQGSVQDSVESGWSKAQDVVSKRTKQPSEGLTQATSSAKDVAGTVMDSYEQYQESRQRARMLFRWGLVLGVILALLYTPVTGVEVRRRISEQWEQYGTPILDLVKQVKSD
jgi:methyl-accepting chemotaxis protein